MAKKNSKPNNNRTRKGKGEYEEKKEFKSKGGRSGSRAQSRGKSEDVAIGTSDSNSLNHNDRGDNDVSWYMKNDQLFKDASNYWISKVTGTPLDYDVRSAFGLTAVDDSLSRMPGILVMDWIPSTGIINRDDAVLLDAEFTAAGKNMYNFIVHANSRSVNYEAADIIQTVMAADSIYSAISACVRAYGVARTIVQENRYYGEATLRALGFDPASVLSDLSNFREQINYYIALASTIWVPNDIDLIKRHYWMNTNVYSDSEDVTGQLYAYRQKVFYQWTPKTSTQGSELTPIVMNSTTPQTVSAWMSMIRSLIYSILDDDDPQTMMGDMMKAYGADKLFALQPISESYTVIPVHNYEVLLQIHNTDFALLADSVLATTKISQDVNRQQVYQHYDQSGSDVHYILDWGYVGNRLLDFPSGYTVTKEAIMVATRNKLVIEQDDANSVFAPRIYCGTECFIQGMIYRFDASGALVVQGLDAFVKTTPNGALDIYGTRASSLLSRFDFAPFYYAIEWTDTTNHNQTLWGLIGDNNQGRPMDKADLKQLHQVAIMSELNIPFMG